MSFEDTTRDYELQEEQQMSEDEEARRELLKTHYGGYNEDDDTSNYFIVCYLNYEKILTIPLDSLGVDDINNLYCALECCEGQNIHSTLYEVELSHQFDSMYIRFDDIRIKRFDD